MLNAVELFFEAQY